MAHFAKIENGIVTMVLKVDDSLEATASEWLHEHGLPGEWIQTSYNANIRGKYAAIGDTYDRDKDIFVAPVYEDGPTPEELSALAIGE